MQKSQLGLILLSGGLDSTTAAAWALREGLTLSALSFDYGQTHRKELQSASAVANKLDISHNVVDVSFYRHLAEYSALTQPGLLGLPTSQKINGFSENIPSTYVPLRNTFFLTMAAAWLESKALFEIENNGTDPKNLEATIIIAANAIDYSGYPDCRPAFYKTVTDTLKFGSKLGMQYGISFDVVTPLLEKSKSDIVLLAEELNAPLELTWSCYAAGTNPCGNCDACLLRTKGFAEAGIVDPAIEVSN